MITFAGRVQDLMNACGIVAEWQKITGGTYNVATGKVNGGTITPYNINVHVKGYEPRNIIGIVEAGDKELRMASNQAFNPAVNDTVLIDGARYNVLGIDNRMQSLTIVHLRGVA